MVTVAGKTLGRKKPLFDDFSIPLPPLGRDRSTTLRDVIEHLVRGEVEAFRQRQDERQVLRALTSREIAEGAAQGKVAMGESEVEPQEVDAEQAVAAALQAFEDGLYLVAIDGVEQTDLDAEVHLHDDSRITLIRLTLLAGG